MKSSCLVCSCCFHTEVELIIIVPSGIREIVKELAERLDKLSEELNQCDENGTDTKDVLERFGEVWKVYCMFTLF